MNSKISRFFLVFFILNIIGCSAKDDASHSGIGGDKKVYIEATHSKTDSVSQQIYNSRQNAITKAVAAAVPAIVSINVVQYIEVPVSTWDPFDDPFFQYFFGGRRLKPRYYEKYPVKGLGSGFIISPDGYILTNHHVAGQASKIIVTTTDGKQYDAEIVGSDYLTDVALLKINAKNLPFLKLGNSDDVILGEWVIALGNPFGLFDLNAKPTITVGVVSNVGVNFSYEDRLYKNMIQTDAAISSGNSGGPLINAFGEVIGINTVIFSTAQSSSGAGSIGIGWAVPINRVKKVVDKLIENRKLERNPDIGIEMLEPNAPEAKRYGINFSSGLYVISVKRNSPAAQAGIEPEDIILAIDGKTLNTMNDYYLAVFDAFVGDVLTFKIQRGNQILEKKVTIRKSK
jgi:serine protease Do